jgi:chromosome partitioning protein
MWKIVPPARPIAVGGSKAGALHYFSYTAYMRSIAVINQKGGVGKTTTAVNLAAALSRAGQRVLLVDLDPQAHATLHLGTEPGPGEPSIYDVLTHRAALGKAARTVGERLTLVPAAIDLVGAELELADQEQRETVLARAWHEYRTGFDFCLVDCAPSLGLLTINALAAVEEVLIPLQPHFLALQGLGRLLETVALVQQRLNGALHVSGIVLCMYESGTRLAQEVREDVLRFLAAAQPHRPWFGARVFDTVIRRNIKLAECPSFGRTIFDYAPTSRGAGDYRDLAREIVAGAAVTEAVAVAVGEQTGVDDTTVAT